MRKVLVALFLLNVTVIVVTTALLPERVAIHFGLGGEPDSWAPRSVNAGLFLAFNVLLFALFYWAVTRYSDPVSPRSAIASPTK